ncbi:hypothetical protein [Deinococcus radiotolerans]|uniref:RNA polymerase sigma-70 region 2 domain-containing protein n=1 Tax=Deinococcus radiotolerans TaxID=1309407 RepID=A0ABQ2FPH6_9DEIO|nr:hypothetical protein [Deinococcus radiotolerans]GGL14117.1 hypothetical protein GCM10010844_36180 [Deinococcus radiotolerans]
MTELQDPRTDDVLLHAIAQQDTAALAELYRRYAGRGLSLAYQHHLPDPRQAIEDAFAVLFQTAQGFSRSSLPAEVWTLGMMYRHCVALTASTARTPG